MWSPHDPNLIATSSADFRLAIWNLATEQCIHTTYDVGTVPLQIDWCRHDPNLLVALCDTGRVVRWRLMYPRTTDRIDVGACADLVGSSVRVGAGGSVSCGLMVLAFEQERGTAEFSLRAIDFGTRNNYCQ